MHKNFKNSAVLGLVQLFSSDTRLSATMVDGGYRLTSPYKVWGQSSRNSYQLPFSSNTDNICVVLRDELRIRS